MTNAANKFALARSATFGALAITLIGLQAAVAAEQANSAPGDIAAPAATGAIPLHRKGAASADAAAQILPSAGPALPTGGPSGEPPKTGPAVVGKPSYRPSAAAPILGLGY
jgi:hypothetical protein